MQNPERGEVVGPVRDVESAAEHISRGYGHRSCFYESTLEIRGAVGTVQPLEDE